jgi:predicted Zn-dependent protease
VTDSTSPSSGPAGRQADGLSDASGERGASDGGAAGEASLFEQAISRYNAGAPAGDLIADFQEITQQAPRQSAGWTCLAWLLLLDGQPHEALRAARTAVRLNPQDPQARVNLSLAMLETGAKGVREHIDIVQRVMVMAPELASELHDSMADGLRRRPGWGALLKVQAWLHG